MSESHKLAVDCKFVLSKTNHNITDLSNSSSQKPGIKGNDQLVAYATRFLAVRLKFHMWSHHCALAKVQCNFSNAYSADHTTILQLINIKT